MLPIGAQAQTKPLTATLRSYEAGKGVIVIRQSSDIEDCVNNVAPANVNHTQPKAAKDNNPATPNNNNTPKNTAERNTHIDKTTHRWGARTRHKAKGYRICIFTGGNSRADKAKAQQMGEKCRKLFSELATYTTFIAPRWVTHVGDFKTKEDAAKYATRIRRAGFTYEARIIATEVNLPDE